MTWSTYFIQECPTCGRSLQVRVRDLGKHVLCEHCKARFTARDAHSQAATAESDAVRLLIDQADDYLATHHEARPKPK